MSELISVIVPVYNAEQYIEHCIESILKQTYRNFELILVNDGSKDNSLELCKAYANKDQRIKVFDRENGGASAARNTGLLQMKGTYVVFVDSDDYIARNYIENLYLSAKLGDYDIVQCNLSRTTNMLQTCGEVTFQSSDVREIQKIEALNHRLYMVSVCGKIYASHIFEDFQFKEGIIYEDDASYYIFVDRAKKIALLNETLYYYFMSDNSVMRNEAVEKNTDFIGVYEDRIKYFENKHDKVLLGGSYCRYCLVLMLATSKAITNKNRASYINQLISLYNENYSYARKAKQVKAKDKVILLCFRLFPKIVGGIIGRLRK